MRTEVLVSRTFSKTLADEVAAILRRGDPVALPTETVYGLAADALKTEAVAKIFEAKERPRFDPLIVHLPDRSWLDRVTDLPAGDRELILKLADRFWPGPLTLILPRRSIVPDIVTGGWDTVAIRMSAHPIFAGIVQAFGSPLAAPSANRFGRISPTTAQHVVDELGGRIPLIIDAGPTLHGVESTVIAIRQGRLEILRPGPITIDELSAFGPTTTTTLVEKISGPGQLPSHYAPKTRLRLVDDAGLFANDENLRVGLLAWNRIEQTPNRFVAVRYLSEKKDLRRAAANLFRLLRELDLADLDLILAESVPDKGLGCAIMDRLRRAAAPD